ncbi:MAG: AGE family epimerase/isomerase [Chitinophagaceae bacterium]|nr:AGE family epimerase/isomerase [Chitinophagaceae bacterium]
MESIYTDTIVAEPVPVKELEEELSRILGYWEHTAFDRKRNRFYGAVSHLDIPDDKAPLGIVMYSRILWAFSAASTYTGSPDYLRMADQAWEDIVRYFEDPEWGAVIWSVTAEGRPGDTKKQLYGIAFCIYALAEYYRIKKEPAILAKAITYYRLIEQYGLEKEYNGYVEAFTRDWKPLGDLRLSEKDNNERKTMNTHLHIVEAYANLYSVWPDAELQERIINLLRLFDRYFIDQETGHLRLFFNDEWECRSRLISYGHDIEAAWLLPYCAGQAGLGELQKKFNAYASRLAEAAARGLDGDGGLWYEFDPITSQLIREKHSWPQAEALPGFLHVWKLTGEEKYLKKIRSSWNFIRTYLSDPVSGEWFWGIHADYTVIKKDKAGFWKCPYHNTRAILSLLRFNEK